MSYSTKSKNPSSLVKSYVNPITFEEKKKFFYEHANDIINSHHNETEANYVDVLQSYGKKESVKTVVFKKMNLSSFKRSLRKMETKKLKSLFSQKTRNTSIKKVKSFDTSTIQETQPSATKSIILKTPVRKTVASELAKAAKEATTTSRKLDSLDSKTRNGIRSFNKEKVKFKTELQEAKDLLTESYVSKDTIKLSSLISAMINRKKVVSYKLIGKLKMLLVPDHIKNREKVERWKVPNYLQIEDVIAKDESSISQFVKNQRLFKGKLNVLDKLHKENLRIVNSIKKRKKYYTKINKYVDPRSAIIS